MKARHPKVSQAELCRSLGVSRQAHHKHKHRSERVLLGQEEILQRVQALRVTQPKLGGIKLYAELKPRIQRLPVPFGRDQFFDLLRKEGLLVSRRRKGIRTTMSRHGLRVYPDLVKGLEITRPGQVWASDITYWKVEDGFYFIFLITDVCSKKIIGHRVDLSMDGEHALRALRMAQRCDPHPLKGIIHHSDRGSQYCYRPYVKALKTAGMRISMTESSDPRDNAVAERVNGILKNELLAHHRVTNIIQARVVLTEAVRIYNEERPHLRCDMLKPEQAHQLTAVPKRRWKNYYRPVNLAQDVLALVNPPQEQPH
jgi:transposase InsO family protein